ncbi:MAG: hypothetical protein RQ899_13485 [Pseudomonadales bacterium]|nr:hypothetical protein [Pseudomonadales bacterium]
MNDMFAFAPIAAFLLGASDVQEPALPTSMDYSGEVSLLVGQMVKDSEATGDQGGLFLDRDQ